MAELLGISSQLLGMYESGKRNPKIEFHQKWKDVFKEDLLKTNVSRETNKGDPEVNDFVELTRKLIEYFEENKKLRHENELLKKENQNLKKDHTPMNRVKAG